MFSFPYYIAVLPTILFLLCAKEYNKYFFAALFFLATFDVTIIAKAGLTVGFFELGLILLFLKQLKMGNMKLCFQGKDKIYLSFLLFSFISIIIANVRLAIGDLSVKENELLPFLRSFMSLGKYIFYFVTIIFIRDHLAINNKEFMYGIALGGLPAAIAVILQALPFFNFILIHNNPSLMEPILRIAEYSGELRPVGLTNEASFFAYQISFSLLALTEIILCCGVNKLKSFIIVIYGAAIIISLSRTGYLAMIIIFMFYIISSNKLSKKIYLISLGLIIIYFLSFAEYYGFNVLERFISTFDVISDYSTIERYGVTEALMSLALDKSILFGIGIYNYGYYIKEYLPESLYAFYDYDYAVPSFNFLIQVITEFGIPLFILFFAYIIKIYRRIDDRFSKRWLLLMLYFSLTFQIFNFSVPFLLLFNRIPSNKSI